MRKKLFPDIPWMITGFQMGSGQTGFLQKSNQFLRVERIENMERINSCVWRESLRVQKCKTCWHWCPCASVFALMGRTRVNVSRWSWGGTLPFAVACPRSTLYKGQSDPSEDACRAWLGAACMQARFGWEQGDAGQIVPVAAFSQNAAF